QIVEDLAEIDIRADAGRDHVREADLASARPIEQRRADGARLRDERDASALGHRLAEARVELRGRTKHAETIRPDEADPVSACDAQGLVLERATGGSGLAEAAGKDHCRADAGR